MCDSLRDCPNGEDEFNCTGKSEHTGVGGWVGDEHTSWGEWVGDEHTGVSGWVVSTLG